METGGAERKALLSLLEIMPLFKDVKVNLENIRIKFLKISYYKNFIFKVNDPSLVPIEEAETFTLFMIESKKLLLEFEESFNKNDLPKDLRKLFTAIFLSIAKDGLFTKEGVVFLGKETGSWSKTIPYIKKRWATKMDYKEKVNYSLQSYNNIIGYFPLIDLINQLEIKVSKVL